MRNDKNIRGRLRLTGCLLTGLLLLLAVRSAGQLTDPVFTQYMNSMQTINPAYAGMWDKVGIQVFTRRYFLGQDKAPLVTSVSMYKPIKNDNNGLGLNIVEEHFGYEDRLTITADYSYQVKLDWKTYLRLGVKVGILNYNNLLTKYKLDPWNYPDVAFQDDVHIPAMLKWGIGGLVYSRDYYIGLSIPQLVENDFQANRNNFSSMAEVRYAYLLGGYFFGRQRQIRFKPTLMVKAAMGEPVQADFAANWLFFDKFWIGAMYRTNNTAAILTQFVMMKNIRFGYAMEMPFGKEIWKYQIGTHEFRLVYEYDFYKRPYVRKQYF
ncbi:MAG: type IX secretion system membrane protein PorP/SprF [Mangrovibacterium sp.]